MINEITIEQKNEAIALFDDWKKDVENYISTSKPRNPDVFPYTAYRPAQMKYHSSWDWLMPVVEKISKLAAVKIFPGICTIEHWFMIKKKIAKERGALIHEIEPIAEHNEYGFIGNVYHAVYDFIKWYNIQQSNEQG